MKFRSLIKKTSNWLTATPERSLDNAYKAALKIKEIEDNHFGGKKVSKENADYGDSVISYFKTEVNGYLQKINMGLGVFKTSRLFLNISNIQELPQERPTERELQKNATTAAIIFEKLEFIDQVASKYQSRDTQEVYNGSLVLAKESSQDKETQTLDNKSTNQTNSKLSNNNKISSGQNDSRLESASQKTGVLPRSFINTLNKIKQEIDPKSGESEEQVLNKYRKSRLRTALSIKFILLLIIVPLLTHQLTKTFLLTPIIHQYFQNHEQVVFINKDLEEEAFEELSHYEEILRFQGLIGLREPLTDEEVEEKVQEKAREITEEYRAQGIDSIGNVFADLFSVTAFAIVIVSSRKEIEVLKSFLDEILYGLSDPAKAFLIILFTDMFVGFHSPHGWEVILEGVARHFGLPENQEFNFLFIATFPVILDTVLKYWIFRYLNRISPSAVATYKNMNE
ncbi:CemA family protein, probable integral membrane protein [Crocosphaera subtropica ATCC 51142]|uniref:Proton extrusion protein PxcA n=1 Tax=Crocosphaera subtropica (strain ATCC 51142 / BH68) TaxID=43989 RepID=PXCA_CROS5|nr:proton extrusion protein PcxA [Crocosphaera subtropica]B1X0Z7.1 RecName: Full=Proton extrusion protein PxcA [Crocosphaera subtropica ATCC 51142]ACB49638.1 CemA family protein, probable integral membrane protein [Crocosphaera subtropica ATCC 51142]